MNCERTQELILTDYLDGQLSIEHKKQIDGHLANCQACSAFVAAARQAVFEPFAAAERLKPSDSVWAGIEAAIEDEHRKADVWTDLWENLKSWGFVPRPVMAAALVMVTVLAIGTLNQFRVRQEANAADASEYLDSLADVPGEISLNDDDGKGFGTAVEQYFL
jgi:anti-sigma-K factor RskA